MASCCSCLGTAMATTSAMNLVEASNVVSLLVTTRNAAFGLEQSGTQRLRWRSATKSRRNRRAAAITVAQAEGEEDGELRSQQLAYDGPGRGGQWLSATTRHVRIYVGVADPETKALDQSQLDKLTLMLDPDNEFVWPDEQVQKVYDYFTELVDGYEGAPCTEYTLRLIGSDIEHYIRKLLLANEIKYNLDASVLNFSMGVPRYDPATLAGVEEEAG